LRSAYHDVTRIKLYPDHKIVRSVFGTCNEICHPERNLKTTAM